MDVQKMLSRAIAALESGTRFEASEQDMGVFASACFESDFAVSPAAVAALFASLGEEDLPVLKRALIASQEGEQAWLALKIVSDEALCVKNTEEGEWLISFDEGSADARSGIFLGNESREIFSARRYSPRDRFQIHDATRGPLIHVDQFPGLTWRCIPLFSTPRVVVFGAGEVGKQLCVYAKDAGFTVCICDDDERYLDDARLDGCERVVLDFADIDSFDINEQDYVCVLTRSHINDPEALLRAIRSPASFVGMIGHIDKVAMNFDLAADSGVSDEELERVHTPIGIKFGAKSPNEIAMSIIAQLIETRHQARKASAGEIAQRIAARSV